MNEQKTNVEVIVNGQPVSVAAGPIRDVVTRAVEASGQIGAPVDQWVLRTRDGEVIPHALPGGLDFALVGGQRVFMHLGLPMVPARASDARPTRPDEGKATGSALTLSSSTSMPSGRSPR